MKRSNFCCNLDQSYIIQNNVRIYPDKILFSQAYDGKEFKILVRIVNCGLKHALIRVCPPKSKAVKLINNQWKSFILSPGLSFKRYVKYTHKSAEKSLPSILPIYINDKLVPVRILVEICEAGILLSTDQLDFGTIDIAGLLTVRTLKLYNNGSKTGYFAIDLPANEMELSVAVEPMKGTIQTKKCITITVELMSFIQGPFVREFWIKTSSNSPQVVKVKGHIIRPRLKILFPNSFQNMTIVHFPKIYNKSECIKNIIVKNESSINTMFYVQSLVDNNLIECCEDKNFKKYKFFEIHPICGQMQPFQAINFQIKFMPHKILHYSKNYALSVVNIIKLHDGIALDDLVSSSSITTPESLINNETEKKCSSEENNSLKNDFIQLYIYGEMEELNVELTPNNFCLFGLKLHETCRRVVNIKNHSNDLPIKIQYNKIVSVEVEPKTVFLRPCKSIDVTIKITPVVMCDIETEISFNLIHCENRISTVVGKVKIDLFYSIHNTRTNEIQWKNEKQHNNILQAYDDDDVIVFNEKRFCLPKLAPTKYTNIKITSTLSPLSPECVRNIVVPIKIIYLGDMIKDTICKGSFSIFNNNSFPIRINTSSRNKAFVVFGKNVIINGNDMKTVTVGLHPMEDGKLCVPFSCLVNGYDFITIVIIANVIPSGLTCNEHQITLNSPNDIKFIELKNALNTSIDFKWITPIDSNIIISPVNGTIANNRKLVGFVKSTGSVDKIDDLLLSTNPSKFDVNLEVSLKLDTKEIKIGPETLNFENIPLNTVKQKEIILKNASNFSAFFHVINSKEFEFIQIAPESGRIYGKSTKIITVSVLCKQVISFKCKFQININQVLNDIHVNGNAIFPNVSIMPQFLQICDIVPHAIQEHKIKLKNLSIAECRITFEKYPDLCILDEHKSIICDITLKPNETKHYFIQFRPGKKYVSCFFLPIKINDILGPSTICKSESMKASYFLQNLNSTIHKTLPILKINYIVLDPIIEFSDLILNFDAINRPTNKFFIKNVSTSDQEIFLNTFNLPSTGFTIKHTTSDEFTIKELSNKGYLVCVKPNGAIKFDIFFEVNFEANLLGTFNVDLPIYVRSYPHKSTFNCLKLCAVHKQLDIINEKDKIVSFPPVPILTHLKKNVKLILRQAKTCSCSLKISHNINDLKVTLTGNIHLNENVEIHFDFVPQEERHIFEEIELKCTCNKTFSTFIFYAIVDNSLLVSYKHLMNNDSIKWDEHDIVKTLENWLFTQCFYRTRYFEIPEGVDRLLYEIEKEETPCTLEIKCTHSVIPAISFPLVNILKNLGISSISKIIEEQKIELCLTEPKSSINAYNMYKTILECLLELNIIKIKIDPELLLSHKQYTILMKRNKVCNDSMLDEISFEKQHKTCWINLLLNIYKCLVLNRVKLESCEEYLKQIIENNSLSKAINTSEAILLHWLNHHYTTQSSILWLKEKPDKKQLKTFLSVEASKDCLIFVAVTCSYCPYLTSYFSDLFIHPVKNEEFIHNACRLVQAWNKIFLSYDVTPTTLISLNPIEMLILTVYLYNILPTCSIKDEIIIDAALTEIKSTEICIKNPSKSTIAYEAVFLQNEHNLFTVSDTKFLVPAKKEYLIKIFYTARKLFNFTAVLFFSGESNRYSYARNIVYKLIGRTDIFIASHNLDLSLPVYNEKKFEVEIPTPYQKSYYSCLYLIKNSPPNHMNDLIAWQNIKRDNILRVFNILEDKFVFDDDGMLRLTLVAFSSISGIRRFRLYFVNNGAVGDFCVELTLKVTATNINEEILFVKLTEDISNCTSCICKNNIRESCPKTVVVELPCKNKQFWDNIPVLLNFCWGQLDYIFWSRFLETSCGFRILNKITNNMYDVFGMKCIFSETVSYAIKTQPENNKFTTNGTIKINDVTTEECVQLLIHWNGQDVPKKCNLQMDADHGQEIRYYKIVFGKNYDTKI